MSKCDICSDGIIYTGESIKKVCHNCGGTGKIIEILPEEESAIEEESFLVDTGETLSDISPEDN